mmetsp:Transcript_14340/g.45955  ORF Transcript_14340/g.45955 Transcript_14340/m.45955 type:complete len:365 (+) Transcript_14340:1308-2402(+)
MRRYLGEQVTEQLVRAGDEATDHLRKRVHATRDDARTKLRGYRDNITDQVRLARDSKEELFSRIFGANAAGLEGEVQGAEDLHAESDAAARFWQERSTSWLDTMTPQGRLWFDLALPSSLLDRDADLSFAFADSLQLDEEQEHQIKIDLPRTFPGIEYFEDEGNLADLERVLRAVAVSCPELGYVQGMNFCVAYMLLHCKTEAEAHRLTIELLTNPKYNLRGVYEDGLPTLRKLAGALKVVVEHHDPELAAHLEALGFEEYFFAFQWISTLFAYSMPFDALQHVWDLFFERSWEGFFAVCLVLMEDRRPALLAGSFDTVCMTLKTCVQNPREDFAERAKALRLKLPAASAVRAAGTPLFESPGP